jgi:AcrR family transcriptional regulator
LSRRPTARAGATDPAAPATEGASAAPVARKRMGRPPMSERAGGPDAATRLLQAATAEFVERGFDGTSTNRIAERAGFAPQTFYRWYSDKLAVFLAVHAAWAEAELAQLEALLTEPGEALYLAEVCVESQRSFLTFMRSRERLAQDVPEVREVRARARAARLDAVCKRQPHLTREEAAARLVAFEHLCLALAEGEFDELGLRGSEALAQVAVLIALLRGEGHAGRDSAASG